MSCHLVALCTSIPGVGSSVQTKVWYTYCTCTCIAIQAQANVASQCVEFHYSLRGDMCMCMYMYMYIHIHSQSDWVGQLLFKKPVKLTNSSHIIFKKDGLLLVFL